MFAERRDLLEAIVNNITDGITVQDASGQLVLANEAGMKFQMAKRQPATAVPIPCVVNWKLVTTQR